MTGGNALRVVLPKRWGGRRLRIQSVAEKTERKKIAEMAERAKMKAVAEWQNGRMAELMRRCIMIASGKFAESGRRKG